MKSKVNQNLPFVVFCFGITLFSLIFTRFFLKMDDGNFLGIATAPDFSYNEFLSYRYNNISGRTINEFLVMFFCRNNIILWKVFISILLIFIVHFWIKLSSFFNGSFSKYERQIFCSLGIFMMMVSCLNPSVFWFAGSFTYLFPFAGLVAVASPFVFYIYERKFNWFYAVAGVFGTVAACSQEQGAVCCIALILILTCAVKFKKLKLKFIFLIQLVLSAFLTFYLFTSPGMEKRGEMEAQGFERYTQMNLAQKLLCSVSTFFANNFYLSVALILILVALLSLLVYEISQNKNRCKKILAAVNGLTVFTCGILNLVCCAMGKGLAHMLVREAFKSGEFSLSVILLIVFGFILLATIIALSVILFIKKMIVGFPVLLCLAAGFGCALMMSFSSSIFASGQRVFFFTNMFIITACIILISSIKKTSLSKKVYSFGVFYAAATVVVNIFAFTFAEMPLMG